MRALTVAAGTWRRANGGSEAKRLEKPGSANAGDVRTAVFSGLSLLAWVDCERTSISGEIHQATDLYINWAQCANRDCSEMAGMAR